MGLDANEHVQVFVVGCVFNQVLEFVSTLQKHGTFPTLVWIKVEPQLAKVPKPTDG